MANDHIKATPKAEIDQNERDAKALIENPLFKRALDELEDSYTREWKNSDGPHQEYRERAYYMIKALAKLRDHLNEYQTSGKVNQQRVKQNLSKS